MLLSLASCNKDSDFTSSWSPTMPEGPGGMVPGGGMGSVSDDGTVPGISNEITPWDGTKASDSASDVAGSDSDIYHEANTFTKRVTVTFSGSTAEVTPSSSDILCRADGAYVTVDMATNEVSGVEVVLSGSTTDGGIKLYGSKKFKLTLAGVSIASKIGPAINNQCKKRMFLHLEDATENSLSDCATYSSDPYYLDPTASEDQKGCFFSEGTIVLSGTGVLIAEGLQKHAVATDKSFIMRPGSTLVINGAAKNGLHVKGDDDTGVRILGGYLYANISSAAGKAIKTDIDAEVRGGELHLNTSGNAIYDADDADTSSAAGIKTDGSILISGGCVTVKSRGSGGKGLNADGEIVISGGETVVATCGDKFVYSSNLDSSPKGVKADGNVTVSGGTLRIAATGRNEGAEGLESKAEMTISGGVVEVYAYDDAINASSALNITGGSVTAYSCNNDGIDSNGTLTISGGTVIASGTSAPESGIDVDNTNWFKINGGDIMAVGGTLQSSPSSSSSQYCAIYTSLTLAKGADVKLIDSDGLTLAQFTMPRTISGGSMLISSPALQANKQYTVTSSGATLFSFTTSSRIITTR